VLASLAAPTDLVTVRQTLAASIGVALVAEGTSPDEAIARADAAMYRAKRAGGSRFVLETDEPESSTALVDLVQEEHEQDVAKLLHRLTRATSDVVLRVLLGEVNQVDLVSDAIVELTGRSRIELVGSDVGEFIDARDLSMLRSMLDPAPTRIEAVRMRLRKSDGKDVWCEISGVPILDSLGRAIGVEVIARDATDWIALQHRLNDQALHDPLTLLPTRELFLVKSRDVLVHRASDENTVALMSIDLDGLDDINTALGRIAGDEVVRLVAERIQTSVSRTDLVGRVGGDEFAVLLTSASGPGEAVATASRMCAALAHPVRLRSTGEEVYVSASVGLAMASGPGDDPRQLVRDAGFALQRAKTQGAGTWEVFDAEMRRGLDERYEIERDLRRALDRGELRVHYQPEVLFATGEIIGAEALIRWQHPSRGLLGAGAFVDVAEETGLVVPLGWWVMRQATHQASAWHAAGQNIVVRVNLSGRQITHPDLVFEVSSALTESGVDPALICLEITETVLMNEPDLALARLMELKELGVHLAIDDFGTGYSSLAYLKKFPVDVLKIDKSFVDGIALDPQDRAIVATIVSLTQSLQLEVTAEGVETEEQAGELVVLGCRRGQGFLFSKPVPPEDIHFAPVPRPNQ
jgi:diguanylate cyclase (GGDEF)-like protein/PAS domain S-box-containing protein